jgi:hypothetical protein
MFGERHEIARDQPLLAGLRRAVCAHRNWPLKSSIV